MALRLPRQSKGARDGRGGAGSIDKAEPGVTSDTGVSACSGTRNTGPSLSATLGQDPPYAGIRGRRMHGARESPIPAPQPRSFQPSQIR